MKPEDQAQQLNRPAYFYKYKFIDESCQEHSERIFTHDELYLSSFTDFNDSFDCTFRPTFEGSKYDKAKFAQIAVRNDGGRLKRKELREKVREELPQFDDPDFRNGVRNSMMREMKKWGICCFSAVRDNILMWSHYANKHQGFCLEFANERNDERFGVELRDDGQYEEPMVSAPLQVEYSDIYPVANLIHDNVSKEIFLTKAKEWAYEEEWRLIVPHQLGTWQFPSQYLTGVIFGCRMSDEHKEMIREWRRHREPAISYYEARESEDSYTVNIVEIS